MDRHEFKCWECDGKGFNLIDDHVSYPFPEDFVYTPPQKCDLCKGCGVLVVKPKWEQVELFPRKIY